MFRPLDAAGSISYARNALITKIGRRLIRDVMKVNVTEGEEANGDKQSASQSYLLSPVTMLFIT